MNDARIYCALLYEGSPDLLRRTYLEELICCSRSAAVVSFTATVVRSGRSARQWWRRSDEYLWLSAGAHGPMWGALR